MLIRIGLVTSFVVIMFPLLIMILSGAFKD